MSLLKFKVSYLLVNTFNIYALLCFLLASVCYSCCAAAVQLIERMVCMFSFQTRCIQDVDERKKR